MIRQVGRGYWNGGLEAISKRLRCTEAEDVIKDEAGWVTGGPTVEAGWGLKQAGLSTRKTLSRIGSRTGWVGKSSGSGSGSDRKPLEGPPWEQLTIRQRLSVGHAELKWAHSGPMEQYYDLKGRTVTNSSRWQDVNLMDPYKQNSYGCKMDWWSLDILCLPCPRNDALLILHWPFL